MTAPPSRKLLNLVREVIRIKYHYCRTDIDWLKRKLQDGMTIK